MGEGELYNLLDDNNLRRLDVKWLNGDYSQHVHICLYWQEAFLLTWMNVNPSMDK